ncbi:serine/threonine-protein kinase [Streptomyces sp. NPDC050703]|uniref:serine/threonine-protein kinase n=1 Tax=Streptomyces sp. NPDC050703 TaxID=3157218 RepID=UPI003423AE90
MDALGSGDPESLGAYALFGRLGSGGMGEVFLGRAPDGSLAAVKAARPELSHDVEFRRRFAREVDAARKVDGRFTAAVLDADPHARRPWLATAYIPGVSVTEAVAAGGPLPETSLRALMAGTAAALAAIHGAGLTHRDLKPSNILLAEDGPRVIDFGIARSVAHSRITRTGQVPGTPGYMAPEQLRGSDIGPHTDVYALGATLVFAATGEGPFGHGDVFAMIYRTMEQEPRLDEVPGGSLRTALARCLAKDPAERPTVPSLLAEFSVPATLPEGRTGHWLPDEVTTLVRGRVRGLPVSAAVTGRAAPVAGRTAPVAGRTVPVAGRTAPVAGRGAAPGGSAAPRGGPAAAPAARTAAPPPGPASAPPRAAGPAPRTGPSRRSLLTVSAAGVVTAAAGGVFLAVRGRGDDGSEGAGGTAEAKNPLRVPGSGDLSLLLFDGAYGKDALDDAVRRLTAAHPGTEVARKYAGSAADSEAALVGGSPPDLVQYAGATPGALRKMAEGGVLCDLAPLLDAPAAGSPGKKVGDTLLPGAAEAGRPVKGGPVVALPYVLSVYGLWYSRAALRDLGKRYPRTFDELLAVCGAAERRGTAGLVYPGKYPYYLWFAVAASVAKRGGGQVLDALVANEPGAWRSRAVRDVFEAYAELGKRGYVLRASAGYDHLTAQKRWTEGKALFVPNGSWVREESKPPEGFEPAVGPPPGVSGGDRLPFGTLAVNFGEPFVVPERAKNPRAAMELLRVMLGRPAAEGFAVRSGALPAVRGAGEWRGLSAGAASASAAYEGAEGNAFHWNGFGAAEVEDVSGAALSDMLLGRATPAEAIDRIQDAADSV